MRIRMGLSAAFLAARIAAVLFAASIAAVLFAAAVVPAKGAEPFEGVADFKMTMHGASAPAQSTGKLWVGRAGYRSEWEIDLSARPRADGGPGGAPQKMKMTMFGKREDPDHLYMVNDEKKTYSVTDLKKVREDAKDLPKETYTVQRQGTDTVAGIACQKATVTSSKGNAFDVCVSPEWGGSGDWITALTRSRSAGSWISALHSNGVDGLPVRFAMRRKDAREPGMVWELTHLERKPLPASLFEVPADYKKADYAVGGLTPEQEKSMGEARAKMKEALENMTPEQRKAYEDALRKYGQPTPSQP